MHEKLFCIAVTECQWYICYCNVYKRQWCR